MTENGLTDNNVTALVMDGDNVLWAGTDGGGVSCFDGSGWKTFSRGDGLSHDRVFSCAVDSAGVKWFGTFYGVSGFDGSTWKTFTEEDGLAHNTVLSVAVDPEGVKWFGTMEGVTRYDGINWTTMLLP